jgi:uncharacterized protein (TIGR00297 family)
MYDWPIPSSFTPVGVAIFLITGMVLSVFANKLSIPAALTGGAVGWIIYSGAGISGLLQLCTFFLLGTLATGWRRKEKTAFEPNGEDAQQRTTGQVLANAGVAAILALAAVMDDRHAPLFRLMIAASFASATADTLSSELGTVYGRRFYNCLSWKPEPKGLNGVISLEGTLIGIGGACLIALIYGLRHGWTGNCLLIVIAGAIGNLADSILGAAMERKGELSNNWVNFLSVAIGALAAGLMFLALN